jgi:hypothetical protein
VEAERQAEDDRLLAARTLETYEAHPDALWEGGPGRRADLFLAEAADELDTALAAGDTEALTDGFGHLSTVLGEFSGQEDEVEDVLDGFLDGLPLEDPCDTKDITDWLGDRPTSGDTLDGAADIVPRIAPAAIVGCGDDFLGDHYWEQARSQYEQLLDQYPGHDLAAEAEDGLEQAETAIELANLRDLLRPEYAGEQPAYCDNPAPYRGADPYRGGGPHQALMFGNDKHEGLLPNSWLANGAADADIVICVGETKMGTPVATCQYESDLGIYGYEDVTFHKRKVPVRVYEVRTGELISDTALQVDGASCPAVLHYETSPYFDFNSPPSDVYVTWEESELRAAYEPLIFP